MKDVSNFICEIDNILGSGGKTENEIARLLIERKLPITLEGLYPILHHNFKLKHIKTDKKVRGFKWTSAGLVSCLMPERVSYWLTNRRSR